MAAAIVLVVSTVGLVSTITFAVGESRQRAEAESQAETNQAISRFLDKMLSSVDPRKAKGRDVGVLREILNEAASKVGSELSGKPRVEASVRRTIGLTLMNLSLYDEAAPHLERAVEIEESLQRKSHIDLAESLHLLGSLRDYQGQHDEGEALLRQAIAWRRDNAESDRAKLGASLNKLAEVLLNKGRLEEAKASMDESLRIHEHIYGIGSSETKTALNMLAAYHSKSGQYEKAEALYRRRLNIVGESPDDVDSLVFIYNLGVTLKEQGKYDEAEAYYLRAREGYDRVVGTEHPTYLSASNALAALMELQGRHAESETLQREVLATLRRTLGERHPRVHSSLTNLGSVLLAQKKIEESIVIFREAADLAREVHGENHPALAISLGQLGFALRDTRNADNYAESERVIVQAMTIFESTLPKGHPYTQNTLRGLKRLYAEDAMNDPVKLADVVARLGGSSP